MKYAEIIIACIAAILATIGAAKWKDLSMLLKFSVVVAIIAAIFIAINGIREIRKQNKIEKIEAKFGEIIDKGGSDVAYYGNRKRGWRR